MPDPHPDEATVRACWSAVDERVAAARGVTCRRGCDACCRQLVPVWPAELRVLLAEVDRLPGDARNAIGVRSRRLRRQLQSAGIADLLDDPGGVPAGAEGILARQYLDAQVACPLLHDGSCVVYASRPAACRRHVVASDPTFCRTGLRVRGVEVEAGDALTTLSNSGREAWLPLGPAVAAATEAG